MKRRILVIGIICILFLSMCASTGDSPGSDVAYLPKHFKYKKVISSMEITGLRKTSFKVVHIPSRVNGYLVRRIGNNAFENNNLSELIIPETVTEIGNSAFKNNNLSELIIPETVTEIGNSAFKNNNLSELIFPVTVTEKGFTGIGSSAFENNNLSELIFSRERISIGNRAFANNKLTRITFQDSVYIFQIHSKAFSNNNLTSVQLPSYYKRALGKDSNHLNNRLYIDAFDDNKLEEPINVPNSIEIEMNIEGFDFFGIINGSGESRSITMVSYKPNTPYVETNRFNIGTFTIPSYMYGIPVTKIACRPLSTYSVNFGDTVGNVGIFVGRARNHNRINHLILPENLREIEPYSFAFCDFEKVTAPNKVVQDIWDEYFIKQSAYNTTRGQQAFNDEVNRLRAINEELRRYEKR